MIIYNVTINIESDSHDEWMEWMRTTHIPDVMKTGIFTESRMLRVLGDEASGGVTYSIQYTCPSMEMYRVYESSFAPALQAAHNSRYKDRFVAFRTLLETVE